MSNRIRSAVNDSKMFFRDAYGDIRQVEGWHRKFGAAFLAVCIAGHTLGGLSSLYFWAAFKSYAETGGNVVAPGLTLGALSFSIERFMGHSAANHFRRLRTVRDKLQHKKDAYDQERKDHRPLSRRQKVGHGIGRGALFVTLGAAGAVGRMLVGKPESSHNDLKKHSTRSALGLAAFNCTLGLAGGATMKAAEGASPAFAQKALEVAQGHWPTVFFVGMAVAGLLMSSRGSAGKSPEGQAAGSLEERGQGDSQPT